MPTSRDRSKKKCDFEEEDYIAGDDGDDDDDDDEVDFEPDDDADDEEHEAVAASTAAETHFLDGTLRLDCECKLHYKGKGFHLQSVKKIDWNMLDRIVKPKATDDLSLEMVGHFDIPDDAEKSDRKPTPRKLKVAWTVTEPSVDGKTAILKNGRGEDGDGKMPSWFYQVYGCEMSDTRGTARLEFKGGYHPTDGNEVSLLCEFRMIKEPVADSAAMPPTAMAAAAAAGAAGGDSEDEDDYSDDAEDEVDYDELIALHEDAGLSVEALRKRYQEDVNGETQASHEIAKKKRKPTEEEDDDDIEF